MTTTNGLLLERDEPLAELSDVLSGALTGSGGSAVIVAGPGEGKTTLLDAICSEAERRSLRVLRARGSELEREFAHGIVRQLLELPVRQLDDARRAEVFDGAARAAGAVLGYGGEGVAGAEGAADAFAVRHGLYWVLAGLAAHVPMLLAVDDLQWVDEASQRLIGYLQDRLAGLRIALVTATRPPGSMDGTLARIVGTPSTPVVKIGPLGPASVQLMIERRLRHRSDPVFAAACVRATGGNPFAVTELLGELRRRGQTPDAAAATDLIDFSPAGIERNVLARLGQLRPRSLAAVRALAVLDDGAPLRHVAALSGLTADAAVTAFEQAVEAGLLAEGPELRFIHPLMRGGVYRSIGARRRAGLHARAAALLATEQADPEAIAAHLSRSDPAGAPQNVAHLRAAAQTALSRGAPGAAIAHLRRALAEPPDAVTRRAVLGDLGHAEYLVGHPEATVHLEAAHRETLDPIERASLARKLAEVLFYASARDEALAVIDSALSDLGDLAPGFALHLRALSTMVRAALDGGWPEADDARHRRLVDEVSDPSVRSLAEVSLDFVDALSARVPATDLLPGLERRIEVAAAHTGGLVTLPSVSLGLFALVFLDRLDDALGWAERIIVDAVSRGEPRELGIAHRIRELALLRTGAVAEADASVQLSLRLAQEGQASFGGPLTPIWFAEILLERGRVAEARAMLADVPSAPFARVVDCHGAITLARLERADGRPRLAIEILDRLADTTAPDLRNPAFFPWRSDLAQLIAREQPARARQLAASELADAHRIGLSRCVGVALRARAGTECGEEAEATLNDSVTALERSPARLELARALIDLGALLRRDGRRVQAREPLRRALDIAHRCGAPPLATLAADELRAADGRPRQPWVSGVESLTPSELRVARYAAAGHTNRQIAQALFITSKTVETHLSAIYRKLGIRSRDRLSTAIASDTARSPTPAAASRRPRSALP